MYYINETIKTLDRIFDQNTRDGYLRLDLNENPGGLPQSFINEVISDVTPELVSKYPETEWFQNLLSKKIQVNSNQVCLTNGSAEAIRYIIELFSRPGGKIVSVTPAYAMYEVFSKMYSRRIIQVPYKEPFQFDMHDLTEVLSEDIDLMVVMNPNNPAGDSFTEEEMRILLDYADRFNINVLIDEAYYYFCPTSFLHFALERDNVIITRTFSKLFSLAGCRLGYCIGQEQNVNMVQKMCTPHNVNAFALKFAGAILNKEGMLESMIRKQRAGRNYLIKELSSKGYNVSESKGNFVFVETKRNAKDVVKELKQKGILVKYYEDDKYSRFIRVTTGEIDIMKRFLDIFNLVDNKY